MTRYTTCSRVAGVMLSFVMAAACGAAEADSQGLDVKITGEATAADAGLPAYPGSKPYKDADQSSSAGNVAIATPLFGLKVVAMNFESADKPERVAAFYRKALSKYGKVLACSAETKGTSKPRNEDSEEVVCDPDDPGTHSVVYKVGVEDNQRIVAIKPHGAGTRFSLVHVDTRG